MNKNPFKDIVALMPETERPLTVADITTFSSLLSSAGMSVPTYGTVVDTLKFLANRDAIDLREEGELVFIKKKVYG